MNGSAGPESLHTYDVPHLGRTYDHRHPPLPGHGPLEPLTAEVLPGQPVHAVVRLLALDEAGHLATDLNTIEGIDGVSSASRRRAVSPTAAGRRRVRRRRLPTVGAAP